MGRSRFALLLAAFTLSGFAALVYQTAWSQELSLVFGATSPAVAAVLAATMAGLAAGARIAGRLEARIARPLVAYARLELAIGLAALLVPFGVRAAAGAQRLFLAGRAEDGVASTLFALGAALLVLFVPNMLMGATLPLVARRVVRSADELGPRVAALYAANTAGAAAGALLGAFVLLPQFGLAAATHVAVATSFAVAALAWGLSRGSDPPPAPGPATMPSESLPTGAWILPAMLVSGAVSFCGEIVWTRLLGHLLGGSIYAFGTMLASFLVGLAGGSALAARWAVSPGVARRAFAVAQLAVAALTLVAWGTADRLPGLLATLTPAGGEARPVGVFVAALLMVPGAVAIGATFPLAVRILARGADDVGTASARVLAWNTVGSIAGAIATGFVLLPALGFSGTVTLAVALNLLLAAVAAVVSAPRLRSVAAAVALVGAVMVLAPPATPWNVLRSTPVSPAVVEGEVAFLAVGRSSTVLVLDAATEWRLSTDGMPEAAIEPPGSRLARQPVARWLSLLPLAARPAAKSMLVVGLGGGQTLEAIPAGVSEVTVVELEPEVVRANRLLAPKRAVDPLADPRVRVVVNDARSYLRLVDRRFDVIVSQPSHPWTSGASHLFTLEFFELCRERLEPGGVFVQWIGLTMVDPPTLGSLLATLGSVFPQVETFSPEPGAAALFLASEAPVGLDATAATAAIAAVPAWKALGIESGDDLLLARVLDTAGGARLGLGQPLNRDHRNLLEARSPRLVRRPAASSLAEIARSWQELDPFPRTEGVDSLSAVARLLDEGEPARALRVAAAIADPVDRDTAFALAALARGETRRGLGELSRLVAAHPAAVAPRRALLRARQRELRDGEGAPWVEPLLASDPEAAAVVAGWRYLAAGNAAAIAPLEERLAAIAPRDLLHRAACRLRIAWRQAAGDPEAAREALALLDPLLAQTAPVPDLLLRARLGGAAGDDGILLASLAEVAVAAKGQAALAPAVRAALAILDSPGDRTSPEAVRVKRLLESSLGDGRGGAGERAEGRATKDREK